MRELRIVVRTMSGTLPLVVAASVSPLSGCGKSERDSDAQGSGGAGQGGMSTGGVGTGGSSIGGSSVSGSSTGGTAGTIIVVGGTTGTGGTSGITEHTGGTAGNVSCGAGFGCETWVVQFPTAGTPVAPGQVCATAIEPVESARAAFVSLERSPSSIENVTGTVTIDPAVTVIGTPFVEVLEATHQQLLGLQVSALEPVPGGGFSFQGSWGAPLNIDATEGYARMTMRVTLDASCDDGSTRQVHAVTDVHLCLVDDQASWVSSGQTCCVCRIIAEMAPSPIVPDKHTDDLPLAQAMRLRIVELARVSNAVILFAENDGGPGLEYEWVPSTGRIERLDDDVVLWILEEGMSDPFIQAAVYGANAAAVASFAFNDRAAA